MNQQNALLFALNALQSIDDTHPYPIAKHAIVQISKALAQPEQPMTPEHLPKYIATNGVKPMEGGGGGGAQGEPQVCCGDYEKCMNACTPRGRWLAEKELAKPEREPVAWMEDSIEFYAKDHPTNSCTIPLYTAPPSKPWVSLTDDEIRHIVDLNTSDDGGYDIFCDGQGVVRATEFALRSKNT